MEFVTEIFLNIVGWLLLAKNNPAENSDLYAITYSVDTNVTFNKCKFLIVTSWHYSFPYYKNVNKLI